MTWLEQHHELAIAILSPLLLAVGYLYRGRVERRANLREALYLLLEIWHRLGLVSAVDFEEMAEKLISRMRALFPGESISEVEVLVAKAHFLPILRRLIRAHALSDVEGLQDAYQKVVLLVARSHPVYAYKLESASSVKKRLAFVDQYLVEAFGSLDAQGEDASAFIAKLRERVSSHSERDAMGELEGHLRGLAWRVSLTSLIGVHRLIRRRRLTLALDSSEEFDRWITGVVTPMLNDPSTAQLFSAQALAAASQTAATQSVPRTNV